MSSKEWRKIKLGDNLDALIDYRGKTPKKTLRGIPLITAKIVKNGFIEDPNEFIAVEDYESWMTRGIPKIGDVVLTVEAPLGEVAQINSTNIALAQRIITLRGKEGVLDNGYLKYFLQSDIGQNRLRERETGTTVTGIKQSELKLLEIDCPDFNKQQIISKILSDLDNKIVNNFQTNKTLEKIAKTIFKEWFINFNYPNADGKMKQSEFGKIPEDWEVRKFGDLAEQVKSSINPSLEPDKEFNHYSIPAFDANELPSNDLGSSILSNKTLVKKYSVLFSKLNPRISRVWSIGDIDESNSICSTEFIGFIPKKMNYYSFLNYFLKQPELITKLSGIATGTSNSHQRIKPTDLLELDLLVPKEELLILFETITRPFLETRFHKIQENKNLRAIRDSLLPRLMSGQIDING